MFRRRLWLSGLLLLVAGCAAPVHAQKPTGWVRSDLTPVSQPVLADGRLVLYVAAGGGLQVVALDPETGQTLWHDNASPGDVTAGVFPVLGVAGSIVTFLRPVDNRTGSSQVVGVDAATGQQVWRSPTGAFTDWPESCPDDLSDICTTGSLRGVQQFTVRQIQGSDGGPLEAVVVQQSSSGGRALGDDLFDPGTRDPEKLVSVSDGSVAWTRPLASVFPFPGTSTSYGWNFDRVPAAGVFVGWAGPKPVSMTKTSAVYSLSRNMTAGFRISNGTVVWRNAGTQYACGQPLPCPGTLGTGYPPPTTGLRLRATGTITYTSSASSLSRGADVKVEDFDLATGKTLWSYDAGPDSSLLSQTPPLLGPYVVALPSPSGGTVALNLATGTSSSAAAGAVAWCPSTVTYKTQVGWQTLGTKALQYMRVGQQAIKPCRVSGAPVAVPKTVPGFVGTVVDGLTVWSGPHNVTAVPASS